MVISVLSLSKKREIGVRSNQRCQHGFCLLGNWRLEWLLH